MLQSQVIEFAWDDILQFEVDNDQMTFNFEYRREGRKPRWVRIFTPYVSLAICRLPMAGILHISWRDLCGVANAPCGLWGCKN